MFETLPKTCSNNNTTNVYNQINSMKPSHIHEKGKISNYCFHKNDKFNYYTIKTKRKLCKVTAEASIYLITVKMSLSHSTTAHYDHNFQCAYKASIKQYPSSPLPPPAW